MENNTSLTIQAGNDGNPAGLLQIAIQNNLDMDKLERLMKMQQEWEARQAKKAYLEAKCVFQATVPVIAKKKAVGFGNTNYKYAELGEITQTIKDALSAAGLSYEWKFKDIGNEHEVTCIVSHVNGHSEETSMKGARDSSGSKNSIQSSGSTITYLQRYTLIGALGISTATEDVDGRQEAATPAQPTQPAAQQQQTPPPQQQQAPPAQQSTNPFARKYDTAEDVFKQLEKATTTQDVANLYYSNQELITTLDQKDKFTTKKTSLSKPALPQQELKLDVNTLPAITSKAYLQLIARIEAGETSAYDKAMAAFTFSEDQAASLLIALEDTKRFEIRIRTQQPTAEAVSELIDQCKSAAQLMALHETNANLIGDGALYDKVVKQMDHIKKNAPVKQPA